MLKDQQTIKGESAYFHPVDSMTYIYQLSATTDMQMTSPYQISQQPTVANIVVVN